jgi:hypothetical protein
VHRRPAASGRGSGTTLSALSKSTITPNLIYIYVGILGAVRRRLSRMLLPRRRDVGAESEIQREVLPFRPTLG